MIVKSDKDINGILEAGKVAAEAMRKMSERIRPGMTTGQLDMIGEQVMARYGARSAPQVMYRFPGATCISILPEVAHGIPGSRVIKAGDMVNIDVSVELDGYFADTGMSIALEIEDQRAHDVCRVCLQARDAAIAAAVVGGRVNAIGSAVEEVATAHKLTMIKNLCGHGLGRSLHEAPESILNYYSRQERGKLSHGHVIAIEPFISEKPELVSNCDYDEWALVVPAGYYVAQYEHTIIVLREGNMLVTELP